MDPQVPAVISQRNFQLLFPFIALSTVQLCQRLFDLLIRSYGVSNQFIHAGISHIFDILRTDFL